MASTQDALYRRIDLDLSWSERDLPERVRTKHVHRLHPYLGKFIPQLVEALLERHVPRRPLTSELGLVLAELDPLPLPVDEPLGQSVTLVEPDAVANLDEVVRVGVNRMLAPVPHRLSLLPVGVRLEPFLKFLCSDRVHSPPPDHEGSAGWRSPRWRTYLVILNQA